MNRALVTMQALSDFIKSTEPWSTDQLDFTIHRQSPLTFTSLVFYFSRVCAEHRVNFSGLPAIFASIDRPSLRHQYLSTYISAGSQSLQAGFLAMSRRAGITSVHDRADARPPDNSELYTDRGLWRHPLIWVRSSG